MLRRVHIAISVLLHQMRLRLTFHRLAPTLTMMTMVLRRRNVISRPYPSLLLLQLVFLLRLFPPVLPLLPANLALSQHVLLLSVTLMPHIGPL